MTIKEFDDNLINTYPALPWREPVTIKVNGTKGFGCRLCIARLGLRAKEPEDKVFSTLIDFQLHMKTVHPKKEDIQ